MGDGCISPAQYARRVGLTANAVYKQLTSGRLQATRTADGKWRIPVGATVSDDPSPAPLPRNGDDDLTELPSGSIWLDPIPEYEESRAARMYWQSKCAEQEYLEKAGKLVPLEGIERRYAEHVARVRTKLLGVPSRLRGRLRLSDAQYKLVTELIEEALMDLSDSEDTVGEP